MLRLAPVEDAVELLIRLGRVRSGSLVLDIPCGQGRHAIRLAEVGADVTGVDASSTMLARAMRDAEGRAVELTWIHSDMRQLEAVTPFDFTICLGGSFGYFGRNGDQDFLGTLWHALKPSGILALDVPSLEYIRARHNPRHESSHSHQQVIQQRHLDPETGAARIDVITVSRRGAHPAPTTSSCTGPTRCRRCSPPAASRFSRHWSRRSTRVPDQCRPRPAGCAPAGSLTAERISC
jgi:SAM-dependent methyltransferase